MKYLLVCTILCMVLCNIAGLPQPKIRLQQPNIHLKQPNVENKYPVLHPIMPPNISEIQSRVTCDLISFFGVNHAACAAHCLYLRYRGGYCNERRVCVCRS